MEIVRVTVMLSMLAFNSIYDWKYKKISVAVTAIGMIASVLLFWLAPVYTWLEIAGGVGVGIFLILCSIVTRGQIGMGDGIVCCFAGLCSGFADTMGMVFLGLLLSAIVSAILFMMKKVGKHTKIPLIPFFFMGYCCMQVIKL